MATLSKEGTPLCPGRERAVERAADLNDEQFQRLVGRRARAILGKVIKPIRTRDERVQAEEEISQFFERINLGRDFLPAAYLRDGAGRANAVCRIVTRTSLGTGSLIADGNYAIGWFHCPKCTKRLLWRDCRDSLKRMPRCFTCLEVLTRDPATDLWVCSCGREWSSEAYRSSVRGRVRLPCPGCGFRLHKATHAPNPYQSTRRKEIEYLTCPKCAGSAVHTKGDIRCESCGYRRR